MKKFKKWWSDTGNKKNIVDLWLWLKYAMMSCFLMGYFEILYGGYNWLGWMMLSGVFFAAASKVSNRANFERSIFRKLNPKFWSKEDAWENKYKLPWIIPDGISCFWHISMAAGVALLIYAASVSGVSNGKWLDFGIGMYFHWTAFSLCYNYIFRKDEKTT